MYMYTYIHIYIYKYIYIQQLSNANYPEVSAMLDAITCLPSLNDRQNSNRSLTSCKLFKQISFSCCDDMTASLKYLDHLQPHSVLLLMPDSEETCHQCGNDNANVCGSENIAYETAVVCTNTKLQLLQVLRIINSQLGYIVVLLLVFCIIFLTMLYLKMTCN